MARDEGLGRGFAAEAESAPEGLRWLTRGRAGGLFVAILLARLWIAGHFAGNFDSQAFRIAAELVLSGRNVYAGTDLYNYSPLWAFVVAAVWKITAASFSRFVTALGILLTASDAASAGVLAGIARRLDRTPEQARHAALLFLANPISVLASSAHGQFDALAILPLLVALQLALERDSRKRRAWMTGSLCASLLVKHVTLFQPLLFWRRVRRGGLSDFQTAIPYLVFLASFLPFASAASSVWRNVIVYGTHGAQPGLTPMILDVPPSGRLVFTAFLAAGTVWAIRAGRRLELPRASLLLWLTTLLLAPGFGVQYLVWPLAIGALYPSAGLGLFTLAGFLYYVASGASLHWTLPVNVREVGVYAALGFWLALEARRASLARRYA